MGIGQANKYIEESRFLSNSDMILIGSLLVVRWRSEVIQVTLDSSYTRSPSYTWELLVKLLLKNSRESKFIEF